MKKIPLIFFFLPFPVLAQVSEDFESGILSAWEQVPAARWECSADQAVSGLYSLRHGYDNPENGRDAISLYVGQLLPDSANVTWRFRLRHGYSPSSVNNWAVFLSSSGSAGEMQSFAVDEAIMLGVNVQGSDDRLKLWLLRGGAYTELLSTDLDWQAAIGTEAAPAIEVRCLEGGTWEVLVDSAGDFGNVLPLGSTLYPVSSLGPYFGLLYRYSSAQDRKLWLDELAISGYLQPDREAPLLMSCRAFGDRYLRLVFNERMKGTDALETSHYLLDGGIFPEEVKRVTDGVYDLFFDLGFGEDQEHSLAVSGLSDLAGNVMVPVTVPFQYHRPAFQDVVINEIMVDPEPCVLLPAVEYIELFNRSDFEQDLENWSLQAGDDRILLPSFLLSPGQYVLLASFSAAEHLETYGGVIGISGFPVLNNDGEELFLSSPDRRLISYVHYSPDWHQDEYKRGGGWSLERIDPDNPCDPCGNWTSSVYYAGGTPGIENSVLRSNPDHNSPAMQRVKVIDNKKLVLVFSEPMDSLAAANPANYQLDHQVGSPQKASPAFPAYDRVELVFGQALLQGTIYFLETSPALTDCSGNPVTAPGGLRVSLPEPPVPGDLVINEVLFNPYPGESDYVEIFNRSDRVFDLAGLYLGAPGTGVEPVSDLVRVSDGQLVFPGDFVLFTANPGQVAARYFNHDQKCFVDPGRLPSLPDEEGGILILDTLLRIIDDFHYNEEMHFPLLRDPEGVSLERIHYDQPTDDPANWHSASETSGFGTPGLPNSQFVSHKESTDRFYVYPSTFSPDNDGRDDILNIAYRMPEPGYVANIILFDARGRKIRQLAVNLLLGTEGVISWDGFLEDGSPAGMGIYLVYAEVFNLTGKISHYKCSCVLARRL